MERGRYDRVAFMLTEEKAYPSLHREMVQQHMEKGLRKTKLKYPNVKPVSGNTACCGKAFTPSVRYWATGAKNRRRFATASRMNLPIIQNTRAGAFDVVFNEVIWL